MNILRVHPALKAGQLGPLLGTTPMHLNQGDLDGACGPHCMLMALMILGVLDRSDIELCGTSKSRSVSQLCWATERNYFSGATAHDLQQMVTPYEKKIQATIYRRNVLKRLSEVIAANGVGIVCIYNIHMNHWVLAVGQGESEKGGKSTTDSFLMLDPGRSIIPLSAWNGRLSAKADSMERHFYDTRNGREKVHVSHVVGVTRVVSS